MVAFVVSGPALSNGLEFKSCPSSWSTRLWYHEDHNSQFIFFGNFM